MAEAQKIVYDMSCNRKAIFKRSSFDCDDRKKLEDTSVESPSLLSSKTKKKTCPPTPLENLQTLFTKFTSVIETFLFFLVSLKNLLESFSLFIVLFTEIILFLKDELLRRLRLFTSAEMPLTSSKSHTTKFSLQKYQIPYFHSKYCNSVKSFSCSTNSLVPQVSEYLKNICIV